MLVGYGVVSFGVLQVVEPIMHALHLPDAVLTYCVNPALRGPRLALLLLATGALAAAPGLAWFFLRAREKPAEAPPASAAAEKPAL